ncbi:H-2 class II histocompatibility antigen, A-Q alpha chain-like isoform X2 [Melanotaenia boesemani]|uniref:H-2 class II histocompatibility antigen, A-Q alpha chain-like isoform X2 n=1 Tax=Melanotaenia boesemani TaxID=1250792 RepID=UPI001C03AD90|nr:H-2 class II histocompatibility antigen, A-Q alpha chain-like isoform X2 [Melanotaenia boesemani]
MTHRKVSSNTASLHKSLICSVLTAESMRAMTGLLNKHRQNKMYLTIILIISGAACINAEVHKLCQIYGCFDSSDTQLCLTLDDDEVYYADFKKDHIVWDSKIPTTFRAEWAYKYALIYRYMCKSDIKRWKQDETATRTKQAPETILYPRDKVIKDEDNTLTCLSNNFFPPKINIRWTKNNKEVAEEDPFIKTIPNPDGTFHVVSYLNFVPKQGDIYSCSVEHEALEEPQTRFWEFETDEKISSGPAVFCGLGISLGLLGVAAGTFFFVKGNQRHRMQDGAH